MQKMYMIIHDVIIFGVGCNSLPAVKVREPLRRPIRCDSETDSKVWMREDTHIADFPMPPQIVLRIFYFMSF